MVALLELIEDRSRMDNSPYANNNLDFQNSPYELQGQEDNGEWWNTNAWAEPSVQYYENPYNNNNNNFDIDSRYGGSNCNFHSLKICSPLLSIHNVCLIV